MALATGAVSIAIGVIYLLLITVLDARGPMRPPPPEALGVVGAPQLAVAIAPECEHPGRPGGDGGLVRLITTP